MAETGRWRVGAARPRHPCGGRRQRGCAVHGRTELLLRRRPGAGHRRLVSMRGDAWGGWDHGCRRACGRPPLMAAWGLPSLPMLCPTIEASCHALGSSLPSPSNAHAPAWLWVLKQLDSTPPGPRDLPLRTPRAPHTGTLLAHADSRLLVCLRGDRPGAVGSAVVCQQFACRSCCHCHAPPRCVGGCGPSAAAATAAASAPAPACTRQSAACTAPPATAPPATAAAQYCTAARA
jgi:hypothetical protein